MEINKTKIKKYFFCFLIAFGIFNYKTYSILNSDNNIGFYKNFIVFKEQEKFFYSPLVLFDASEVGDSEKYFYGILKLNKRKINEDIRDSEKYLSYDEINPLNPIYVFDGNKIAYFIFDKEKKSIKVFKKYNEFINDLEKEGVKPILYPFLLFKILKTHRKLRTHTYNIFFGDINSVNNLYMYDGGMKYTIIPGGF